MPAPRRTLLLTAVMLCLPLVSASAQEGNVSALVEQLFAGAPDDSFVAVVVDDPEQQRYLAFYISKYLELRELRAYVVPYGSADTAIVNQALARGEDATAFTSLLSTMRLSLGAKYVSDVNLDGVNEAVVSLGEGTIRDGFHSELFADHATADAAYRGWLARALMLLGS